MKRYLTMLAATLAAGCGIDPQIWGNLTESDFEKPPPAGQQTVTGKASELGTGAAVAFFTPGGIALAGQTATTGDGGEFSVSFPATTGFVNSIVTVQSGARAYWGIVPQVPAKTSVYDPSLTVTLGTDVPDEGGETATVAFMEDLDVDATTATLLLLAKQAYAEPTSTLAAISPDALIDALGEVESWFADDDTRFVALRGMMAELLSGDITSKPALRPFPAEGESYLDITALKAGADYTGDEVADTTAQPFDDALKNAVANLQFDVCFAEDKIKVVLIVDFREGGKDRNCSNIDRFKWTDDEPGKQMFITGSLHETTPNCDTDEPPCVESTVFDAASQLMGNWSPNIIPMHDDGTQGDAVAGDNLWTISFELPWFDAGAPTNRWVRIGYKFTWGTQGALWTGSEEWPGNQRILELRDINGDRMIVRQDIYGDETTNKDKSNLLYPANGGCGTVQWESDPPREKCVDDTHERMIDSDGDCELDAFPTLFAASPATVPCPDEE